MDRDVVAFWKHPFVNRPRQEVGWISSITLQWAGACGDAKLLRPKSLRKLRKTMRR
jgi:hypothetical protein